MDIQVGLTKAELEFLIGCVLTMDGEYGFRDAVRAQCTEMLPKLEDRLSVLNERIKVARSNV